MRIFFLLTFTVSLVFPALSQSSIRELTSDGAWCWFSDPRAVYTSRNTLVTGWVTKDGSIEAATLNMSDQTIKTRMLYSELEIDDHDNPAFVVTPDQRILAMYAWHGGKDGVIYQKTRFGLDISTFSEPTIIRPGVDELLGRFPKETFTYANPYLLENENQTIYSFGRWIGYKPNMIKSADNGQTWQDPRVIISAKPFDDNNRPYVKYASDGKSKIHLVFTDGHPQIEPKNGVYHCYYENGAFWKSDGIKICDIDQLPFEPHDATLVYQPNEHSGRSWLADVAIDKKGIPYILYTRDPEPTDHRYHYSVFDQKSGKWIDREICKAGKWFPQTPPGTKERESYYHGNMTFDPLLPNVIYISRQINGRFEIEKRKTKDNGKTWKISSITSNSAYDQVRPYVPRNRPKNADPIVIWMENKRYVHWTDFDTSIKYWIDR
ncbi:MAG: BNR-4 repeat-containing protein [Saprospiraceae bacterium]|nr:BNR-4 repeat-containing protein [Saprospiraceae bacterium]